MKSLLALLMSFLLVEMPAFAIHGGYTLGGAGSLQGVYAGTMVPTSASSTSPAAGTFGTNDLGIFTLNVPTTGPVEGVVLIFSSGRTFSGTLQGIPDPTSTNGIVGIISTTFNYTLLVPTTTTDPGTGVTTTTISNVAITASAEGNFSITVNSGVTTTISTTGVTLSGTASVDVSQGAINPDGTPVITETVTFDVEGFQQSATPSSASETLSATTTTTG